MVNNLANPLDVEHNFKPLQHVDLLNNNPNANPANPAAPVPPLSGSVANKNGTGASNPFRLSPLQALTADQGHNESPEQSASDGGKMDGFPAFVGTAGPPPAGIGTKGLVMGYYDGNTVTALWNYAQHFALNDNSYSSQFGPSTPGAINLISGQANGFSATKNVLGSGNALLHTTHEAFADASQPGNLTPTQLAANLTLVGDADPVLDVCSNPTGDQVTMAGKNIGDLLNAKGITWGAFMGGFDLTVINANGTTGCVRKTNPTAPGTPAFTSVDYIPHHAWFQYYASTRNATHARPSSVAAIGHSLIPHTNTPDPANHSYDIRDFFTALSAGNLPAVSFLKAAAFEDGHAGYSDPLDEQHFLVRVINALQKSPDWSETAVVILYDDSDGWYDHQMSPIVNPSFNPIVDTLNGTGEMQRQQRLPAGRAGLDKAAQRQRRHAGMGSLRLRNPAAALGGVALRETEPRRSYADRPDLRTAVHRGQLALRRSASSTAARSTPSPDRSTTCSTSTTTVARATPRTLLLDEKTGVVVSASGGDDDDHGKPRPGTVTIDRRPTSIRDCSALGFIPEGVFLRIDIPVRPGARAGIGTELRRQHWTAESGGEAHRWRDDPCHGSTGRRDRCDT